MKLDYVIVAGGCFWGLEDLLSRLLKNLSIRRLLG